MIRKFLLISLLLFIPALALAEAMPLSDTDFTLCVGDEAFSLGTDATPLIAALDAYCDEPLTMSESDSCMFSGKDREFENSDVLLGTYPIGADGTDQLESILVMTDRFTTARGAAVGMTLSDIYDLYGEEGVTDYDQLVYTTGDLSPIISFTFDPSTEVVTSWFLFRNTAN